MPTDDDLLTISEAARHLRISTWTIRRWANAEKLPVLWTPSGHRRFRRSDLDAALTTTPATEAAS